MLTSAGKKEHLPKNFSYWLLLANSEYCKIFKSIYYEEHLQTAASENVFMKLKKKYSSNHYPSILRRKSINMLTLACDKEHLF